MSPTKENTLPKDARSQSRSMSGSPSTSPARRPLVVASALATSNNHSHHINHNSHSEHQEKTRPVIHLPPPMPRKHSERQDSIPSSPRSPSSPHRTRSKDSPRPKGRYSPYLSPTSSHPSSSSCQPPSPTSSSPSTSFPFPPVSPSSPSVWPSSLADRWQHRHVTTPAALRIQELASQMDLERYWQAYECRVQGGSGAGAHGYPGSCAIPVHQIMSEYCQRRKEREVHRRRPSSHQAPPMPPAKFLVGLGAHSAAPPRTVPAGQGKGLSLTAPSSSYSSSSSSATISSTTKAASAQLDRTPPSLSSSSPSSSTNPSRRIWVLPKIPKKPILSPSYGLQVPSKRLLDMWGSYAVIIPAPTPPSTPPSPPPVMPLTYRARPGHVSTGQDDLSSPCSARYVAAPLLGEGHQNCSSSCSRRKQHESTVATTGTPSSSSFSSSSLKRTVQSPLSRYGTIAILGYGNGQEQKERPQAKTEILTTTQPPAKVGDKRKIEELAEEEEEKEEENNEKEGKVVGVIAVKPLAKERKDMTCDLEEKADQDEEKFNPVDPPFDKEVSSSVDKTRTPPVLEHQQHVAVAPAQSNTRANPMPTTATTTDPIIATGNSAHPTSPSSSSSTTNMDTLPTPTTPTRIPKRPRLQGWTSAVEFSPPDHLTKRRKSVHPHRVIPFHSQ